MHHYFFTIVFFMAIFSVAQAQSSIDELKTRIRLLQEGGSTLPDLPKTTGIRSDVNSSLEEPVEIRAMPFNEIPSFWPFGYDGRKRRVPFFSASPSESDMIIFSDHGNAEKIQAKKVYMNAIFLSNLNKNLSDSEIVEKLAEKFSESPDAGVDFKFYYTFWEKKANTKNALEAMMNPKESNRNRVLEIFLSAFVYAQLNERQIKSRPDFLLEAIKGSNSISMAGSDLSTYGNFDFVNMPFFEQLQAHGSQLIGGHTFENNKVLAVVRLFSQAQKFRDLLLSLSTKFELLPDVFESTVDRERFYAWIEELLPTEVTSVSFGLGHNTDHIQLCESLRNGLGHKFTIIKCTKENDMASPIFNFNFHFPDHLTSDQIVKGLQEMGISDWNKTTEQVEYNSLYVFFPVAGGQQKPQLSFAPEVSFRPCNNQDLNIRQGPSFLSRLFKRNHPTIDHKKNWLEREFHFVARTDSARLMKTEEEFSLDKHQIMSYLDLTEGKRRDYIEQILGSNNRTTSKDREFTREVMRSAEKDTDTGLPVLVAGSFAGFDSEVFFTIAKNQKMDTVYKVRFRPDHGIKPEVKYSEGRMQISRSSIFQPSESDGLTVVVHLPEYIDVVELTYPDVVRFEFKCRHPEKMAILNDQLSSLLNKDLSNLVVSESLRVDYSGFRAGFQEQPTPERKYSLFPENLRLRYEGSSASEEFLSVRQDQNAYIFSVTSEKDECVWFTGQIGGGSERRHFTYLLRRTGQIEQIFQSPDYCSKGGQNDHRR